MHISQDGLELIEHFEQFRAYSYRCPAGYPTIGIGHRIKPGESFTEPMSRPDAMALLGVDVVDAEAAVERYVRPGIDLTQGQFDALTSLLFNIRHKTFKDSRMRQALNREDFDAAAREFDWYRSDGSIVLGLIRRRKAEELLFRGDDWHRYEHLARVVFQEKGFV